jgi:hypothetical protein
VEELTCIYVLFFVFLVSMCTKDPTAFVGWGFPSVWKTDTGYKMLYQGWHLVDGRTDTKLMLAAESKDAIHWSTADVGPPGACGKAYENVTNCVAVDGTTEFSVVYDDTDKGASAPKDERLKMLWANGTISAGSDGTSWKYVWSSCCVRT